jgi:hypothetical protein
MFLSNARGLLTHTGVLTARPAAFAIFALYCVSWIYSRTACATCGMTLVIQRAEHRDTQAIHAKLDELLKATNRADSDIMRIDDKDAEEVEREAEKARTTETGKAARL